LRLRSFVSALALLASLAPGIAAGDPLGDLIERSGLYRQLGEFHASVRSGADRAHKVNPRMTAADVQRLRASIDRVYAPDRLQPRLRAELQRMLSPADIVATLAWIDSPTGKRLAELETKASSASARWRLEQALEKGPPKLPEKRSRILNELITATKTDEFAASLAIESAVGIAEGITGAARDSEPLRNMRDRMEAERAKMVKQLHAQTYAIFAIAYEQAKDEELEQLLHFARTPEGARFHLYAAQAFETAAAQAAHDLGTEMRAVPASPAKP
jgi:hypothetical protein